MGTETLHGLAAVKADTDVIGGIVSQSNPLGPVVSADPTSGGIYARWVAVTSQQPRFSFASEMIKAVLDVTGYGGANIVDMGAGLTWYAQKFDGPARAAGANHRSFAAAEGILAPQTLDVNHPDDARISCEAVITHDGSANNPIIYTDSVALPAPSSDDERFTLGPCTLESIELEQITGLSIEFGHDVRAEGADGDIWPTYAYILQTASAIVLRGVDIDWLKESGGIPFGGKSLGHANTTIYLRKRTPTGFVANGTAQHIKFTAAGLAVIENPLDVSGLERGEVNLRITLQYDGTNDPLTIDTASAIA